MYKDIISYELTEGVSKEDLLKIAEKVSDSWMKHQSGFIKWEIHTETDGSFTDIVYWKSKQHAKSAELSMMNMPHAADWFACYKEGSINARNLTLLADF